MDFEQFLRDRDEALLSMDETKVRAFAKKYDIPVPSNPTAFIAAMYRAILSVSSYPDDAKNTARRWLKSHGYVPRSPYPEQR